MVLFLFLCYHTKEGKLSRHKKSSSGAKEKAHDVKISKPAGEELPAGCIHVRARRGEATDNHSVAERVCIVNRIIPLLSFFHVNVMT